MLFGTRALSFPAMQTKGLLRDENVTIHPLKAEAGLAISGLT